ncbi:MAG: DUF4391 domain-containing protein [Alcaligenes aquatilis]
MTEQALAKLIVSALALPVSSRVDQRVPKKMLIESGAPARADKRLINDAIEEIQWLAALKPSTIGVVEYRDAEREYLEIAVLAITVRHTAQENGSSTGKQPNITRLAELVHRAVPYPVLLLITAPQGVFLSLAHKRWAQNDAEKTVLDGDVNTVTLTADLTAEHPFAQTLALLRQPQANLLTLYQGWIDCLTAWLVAKVTGEFAVSSTPTQAAARRAALHTIQELEQESARLRMQATKEKQMARQVELNLSLKQLQHQLEQVRKHL